VTRPAESSSAHRGPVAVIDGRSCALLNRMFLDKIRMQIRGRDPQFDEALLVIRRAGLEYTESSCSGTRVAAQPEPAQHLEQTNNTTMSTTTAATLLGVTDRAIRKAINEKRLAATKLDGRYRIARDDLAEYLATR
jgi:excisionase family DNA binding protein